MYGSGSYCAWARNHKRTSRGPCGSEDEGTRRETHQGATAMIQVGAAGLLMDEATQGEEGALWMHTSMQLTGFPGQVEESGKGKESWG